MEYWNIFFKIILIFLAVTLITFLYYYHKNGDIKFLNKTHKPDDKKSEEDAQKEKINMEEKYLAKNLSDIFIHHKVNLDDNNI